LKIGRDVSRRRGRKEEKKRKKRKEGERERERAKGQRREATIPHFMRKKNYVLPPLLTEERERD
jgi:hypothetical protein